TSQENTQEKESMYSNSSTSSNSRTPHDSTPSSGTITPAPLTSSWTAALPATVNGLLRRFSSEPQNQHQNQKSHTPSHSPTFSPTPPTKMRSDGGDGSGSGEGWQGVYTPPYRTASPFQPPPLYPVTLKGWHEGTASSARLLSRGLAEEIRLLVPPRLQLCEEWNLVYSLEEDGVSLGTLYKKCDELRGLRNGFVLVVRDGEGGVSIWCVFDGTTTSSTTLLRYRRMFPLALCHPLLHHVAQPSPPPSIHRHDELATQHHDLPHRLFPPLPHIPHAHSASTPERIRFKAFPYSGVNDYMIFCETGFLSVGGGDGHYGLWLDNNFEKGVSSHCLTFGNEPLSEEGEKFEVLGVEVWSIGNS
ncbi:Oxidation resistance protein, partial [Lachnellula hyalina]